ncbi:MAG: NADH:flavin oxidoreductase [Clostridia bacterium]|nr:NADH:flavin oxidoreductase [Clostridia bacterium]
MGIIFEKTKLGSLCLKNHLVRSATWENKTTEDGHMTDELYDIYEKLAKSEVGLIITGYANILKEEQPNHGMMGIYEDSYIEDYKKLTDIVHSYGSKIIMQIAYGGTKTTYRVGERIIFAPGEIPERGTGTKGKAMTGDDILLVEEAFAQAALRIKKAGFDGVEIHAAHTYLINQFLSPYYNDRKDEYGGSLENRMRFLVEICNRTREKVGSDFFIAVKLTASEFFEGGLTFAETKEIARKMEEIGVDAIELSGNIHGKAKSMAGEMFDQHTLRKKGYFLEYARALREVITLPMITVGGFRDLETIEEALSDFGVDAVGVSRPLLAEPDLFLRWKNGDIRPAICVSCSKCRTASGNYCTVFKKEQGEVAKRRCS